MPQNVPITRDLDYDNWDNATDNVLNAAHAELLPFLQYHSAEMLAHKLLERLKTHLETELGYIRDGESDDSISEYSSAQTFREQFVQMGGKIR